MDDFTRRILIAPPVKRATASPAPVPVEPLIATSPSLARVVISPASGDGQAQLTASKKTKVEYVGVGALIQVLGIIALFFFPIGSVIGVVLLVIGHSMSKKIRCSACGNRVDKESRRCPHCQAEFREY
jgi:hypothetical protein